MLRESLAAHRHRAVVDSDTKLAEDVGIHGTPAFVISGYFVGGAQPIAAFRRAIRRALAEKKTSATN
ncbi:MAG: DsbA family protein [Myxococcales bacterium]